MSASYICIEFPYEDLLKVPGIHCIDDTPLVHPGSRCFTDGENFIHFCTNERGMVYGAERYGGNREEPIFELIEEHIQEHFVYAG